MDILFAIGTLVMGSAIVSGLIFTVLCMTRWKTPKPFYRIVATNPVCIYTVVWENPDFDHTGYTGWMDQ